MNVSFVLTISCSPSQIILPIGLCAGLLPHSRCDGPVAVQDHPGRGQCTDKVLVRDATGHDDGRLRLGHVRSVYLPGRQPAKEPEATRCVSDIPVLLCHLVARHFALERIKEGEEEKVVDTEDLL